MNTAEVKTELRRIAGDLLETGGVSPWQIIAMFKQTNEAVLVDLGADALEDLLGRWAKDVVEQKRKAGNAQLIFPGIGQVDLTVTTVSAEGGPVLKRLVHATAKDLVIDHEIHKTNVLAATDAEARANERNLVLLPIMAKHGFTTAGQALDYLTAEVAR